MNRRPPQLTERSSDAVEASYDLPDGAALVQVRRLELSIYEHAHTSISREVAEARIKEAQAVSEQTRYQVAIPAEEKTKQVRSIGHVVVVVALAGFIAACVRPEAGTTIAVIAGIVTGVFGGMYALDHLRTKPKPPSPTD